MGSDVIGRVFHALADPTRRAIVQRLVDGPAPVKALAAPLAMSLPAVMQHLRVLEDAGVIVTEKTRPSAQLPDRTEGTARRRSAG